MDMTLYILALVAAVVGLLGSILPLLPGVILSFLSLVALYFSSVSPISGVELFIWGCVALCAIIMDSFLPALIVRKMGGSRYGSVGATLGVVAGLVAFPPLGIILCPFFGAVMGEWLNDKSDIERAFKVGFGSFLAFVVGTGVKFVISLWILGVVVMSVWEEVSDYIIGIYESIC